jgi:hypothetical protein
MKLKPTLNKYILPALLSMGLACSPLVANADKGHHDWRGHTRYDHGKHGHQTGYHKDTRDYNHHASHKGCRLDHKHGFKNGEYSYRPHGYTYPVADIQRRYRDGRHEHHPLYFLGIFSSGQDWYFLD